MGLGRRRVRSGRLNEAERGDDAKVNERMRRWSPLPRGRKNRHTQTLHDPLGLREPRNHRVRLIGEGPNVGIAVQGPKDSDDESLCGGLGERMGGEDNQSGDGRGGDFGVEEVDNENSRRNEEDGAGGVEREALVSGEFGRDIGDLVMGIVVVEDLGFEGGGGGREEEDGALRWGVKEEERGDKLG